MWLSENYFLFIRIILNSIFILIITAEITAITILVLYIHGFVLKIVTV